MIAQSITICLYRLAPRPLCEARKTAGDTSVFNFAINARLGFDKRFLSDRSRALGLGPRGRWFKSNRPDFQNQSFKDVAVYNTRVMGAAHVENVANLACHTALSYRGGAHTNLPADLQKQEGGERSKSNIPHHTSDVFARLARLPADDDLVPAADGLNTGRKIALLCGLEALNATDELEQTAEVLGASIVKVPLGEAAVPDSSPYTMGGIGLLGTRPSQEAMKECDMLLMVGTSFPYIKLLTKPG